MQMSECTALKEGDLCDHCRKGKMQLLPRCASRLAGRPQNLVLEKLNDLQCDNCGHVHLQENYE
jgi:hypothetical protein